MITPGFRVLKSEPHNVAHVVETDVKFECECGAKSRVHLMFTPGCLTCIFCLTEARARLGVMDSELETERRSIGYRFADLLEFARDYIAREKLTGMSAP